MKLGLCVGGNTIAANSIIQSPGGRSQSGCVGVRVDEPDPPRHAQGISAQLAMWTRPAPGDVTFTSRWRQRSERDEPRTYSADASVDHTSITPKSATTSLAASVDPTEARKATVRRFVDHTEVD